MLILYVLNGFNMRKLRLLNFKSATHSFDRCKMWQSWDNIAVISRTLEEIR
jgi:hypothetical protein